MDQVLKAAAPRHSALPQGAVLHEAADGREGDVQLAGCLLQGQPVGGIEWLRGSWAAGVLGRRPECDHADTFELPLAETDTSIIGGGR